MAEDQMDHSAATYREYQVQNHGSYMQFDPVLESHWKVSWPSGTQGHADTLQRNSRSH